MNRPETPLRQALRLLKDRGDEDGWIEAMQAKVRFPRGTSAQRRAESIANCVEWLLEEEDL